MYTEQMTQALSVAAQISPQTLNNNTLTSGAGVDMSKAKRAMAIVQIGSNAGSITARLQAATSSGGSFSPITGSTITAVTSADKQATIEVRADQIATLLGQNYRYLRLDITEGNSANAVVSGLLLTDAANHEPNTVNDLASVTQRLVV